VNNRIYFKKFIAQEFTKGIKGIEELKELNELKRRKDKRVA